MARAEQPLKTDYNFNGGKMVVIRKKAMVETLKRSLGIINIAAEQVGIVRQTHYDWIEKDPEYKRAIEDIKEISIDFVESKLLRLINGVEVEKRDRQGNKKIVYTKEPDNASVMFYLKCKGKHRGYVERQEVDMSGAVNLSLPSISIKGKPRERIETDQVSQNGNGKEKRNERDNEM